MKLMAPYTPEQKRNHIMRMHLSGVHPDQIARQVQSSHRYVVETIAEETRIITNMGAKDYLAVLLSKTNLALSHHTQVSRSLVGECVYLEQELAVVDSEIRKLAEKHGIRHTPQTWGKGNRSKPLVGRGPAGQIADNKDELDAYYKDVKPLQDERKKLRSQLIEVTKAINVNNSSLVDVMVRMGVPAIAAKVQVESHPDSSIPAELEGPLMSGDESKLRESIVESVDRQRKWLKDHIGG